MSDSQPRNIMCGVAGQVSLDGLKPVDTKLIHRMTRVIAHRGLDGEGHHMGPIGLEHRRLSIIDVNTGAQPMCNEDSTVWITFNGEIYNYVALRSELRSRGHVFKSESDSRTVTSRVDQSKPAVEEVSR